MTLCLGSCVSIYAIRNIAALWQCLIEESAASPYTVFLSTGGKPGTEGKEGYRPEKLQCISNGKAGGSNHH